jgi:hypothetical protein
VPFFTRRPPRPGAPEDDLEPTTPPSAAPCSTISSLFGAVVCGGKLDRSIVRRVRRVYMEVCWVELVRAMGYVVGKWRRAAVCARSVSLGRFPFHPWAAVSSTVRGVVWPSQSVNFLVSRAPFLLLSRLSLFVLLIVSLWCASVAPGLLT